MPHSFHLLLWFHGQFLCEFIDIIFIRVCLVTWQIFQKPDHKISLNLNSLFLFILLVSYFNFVYGSIDLRVRYQRELICPLWFWVFLIYTFFEAKITLSWIETRLWIVATNFWIIYYDIMLIFLIILYSRLVHILLIIDVDFCIYPDIRGLAPIKKTTKLTRLILLTSLLFHIMSTFSYKDLEQRLLCISQSLDVYYGSLRYNFLIINFLKQWW